VSTFSSELPNTSYTQMTAFIPSNSTGLETLKSEIIINEEGTS